MWRSEPAPIQTRSWTRSSPAISTCETPGAGKGATPPGSKPVAAWTSSGLATRAYRVSAAAATLFSPAVWGAPSPWSAPARRSPGTSASVGRPSQTKTRDLTICAREAPTAVAAAPAVGVPSGNSSPRASTPARLSTSATRATGSGHCSTGSTYLPRNQPGRCGVFHTGDDTIEGRRRERARAPRDDRSAFPGRERANSRERRALRRQRIRLRLRVRRPELHASGIGEPRGVRGGARRADDVPRRPRARGERHRARRLGPRSVPHRRQVPGRDAADGRAPRSSAKVRAERVLVRYGPELEHASVVEALAAEPLDELRRGHRVDREGHQRLLATPAARHGHAGDVDAGLTEQRPDPADHSGHVVVEAEHEERSKLELDLEAEDVDEPGAMVAAD